MPAIEARNLTKHYGKLTAIREVTFTVGKGEVVGFLGPNGAGKSTTMRILSGLLPASSGVARICGIPVATQSDEIKRRIGYMAENNPLPEDMRIAEYLNYRGRLKEIPRKKRKSRVEEVMELCDIHRKTQHRVIGALSKGYRQRVGIADAFLAEPEVIIMDEPTIGLDPHQLLATRKLIDNLRGRTTIIISSHILAEVELSCDRVIIINRGRIVAIGNAENLRREFIGKTRYVLKVKGDRAQLLQSVRKIDPRMTSPEWAEGEADGFSKVILETPEREDRGEALLEILHRQPELKVRSLARSEPSLEDIFLAATRRSWEETLPKKLSDDQPSSPVESAETSATEA